MSSLLKSGRQWRKSTRINKALREKSLAKMIPWTLVLFAVLSVILYYALFRSKKKGLSLPGPRGLPLIGNIHQLDKFQYISYSKWAKEFGPLFKVDLANQSIVVISDHKMVKEIFSQPAFSGRIDLTIFDIGDDGNAHGIVNTEGPHWEELRHFSLRQLRDFGFGRNTMEESIMMEVNECIEGLLETKGQPVTNVKDRLLFAVVNSLWFIVTGTREKQNDPKVLALMHKINKTLADILEKGFLLIFLPSLARRFPRLSGYTKLRAVIGEFQTMFRKPVDEHIKTYSENYQRDFTDVFLKEIYATTDPKSAFYKELGVTNLTGTLFDLYLAGSDTTAATLSWMTIYLTKFPGVQKKLQDEIEQITGNTRPCSVADRPRMPYTEALIAETLRYSAVPAAGVGHKVLTDTEFKGNFFPKGTLITANVHYIHFDPAIWGDPENFRPERFLSSDGKTFKKHEALIAFSVGRRQCLGETLARDSLFLFSTNIFQRFSVEFDKNGPDNGFESEVSFVLTPKPFHVLYKDRQK